jgi:hypothetical protein
MVSVPYLLYSLFVSASATKLSILMRIHIRLSASVSVIRTNIRRIFVLKYEKLSTTSLKCGNVIVRPLSLSSIFSQILITILNMSAPRAPRRDYLQLNDGSDEKGDSNDSQPSRSRRRIDLEPKTTLHELVLQVNKSALNESVLNESASQVHSVIS